jgi:predicted dehydrogenase
VHIIDRRSFLGRSCAGVSLAAFWAASERFARADEQTASPNPRTPLEKTYRAAAIGSTGHGDFGHGLDVALVDLPGVDLVAIADDSPGGLIEAGKRCGVERLYSDYRRMLDGERIDLVSVGMRHVDRHEEVVIACARAGKHIYCEKPVSADLASFDRMVAACDENGVKLAVALPNRASPAVQQALALVRENRIGKLRSLRARGKCDRRGGGEDLMVLGYHNLDLMCLFAGEPNWAFAHVMQGGSDAKRSDTRPATEPVGPIAGDCVAAMFGFPNQVHGYFDSHRNEDADNDRFSLEIHGSAGIIAMRSLADVVLFQGTSFNPAKPHQWQPIQVPEWDALPNKYHWCHQHLLRDLLLAVEEDREPIAGIHHVRWAQEMIQGVYVSHLAQSRVSLPLSSDDRSHPLL